MLTLPVSHLWLLALIPLGLAIMPIDELTILLLLVLAADAAMGLLLIEDLRAYRLPVGKGYNRSRQLSR